MTSDFTVIRDSTPASAIPKGAVVAMGNFDGVHLGHRAVIEAALAMGRAHGRPALALTFEPHPRSFFSPNSPQFRLTDEAGKSKATRRNRARGRRGDDLRQGPRRNHGAGFHSP